jgi:hypothetical protein
MPTGSPDRCPPAVLLNLHRTTFALTNFFNGLANQAQQQQLKKAQQTALPKL